MSSFAYSTESYIFRELSSGEEGWPPTETEATIFQEKIAEFVISRFFINPVKQNRPLKADGQGRELAQGLSLIFRFVAVPIVPHYLFAASIVYLFVSTIN